MSNETEFNLDRSLDTLKNSTIFHMSLGSKELFHSNFLYWLSERYPVFFMKVIHKLANLKDNEKFWWEDCKSCNKKKPYSLENGNVKVLRENKHFDLSIYILISDSSDDPDNQDSREDCKEKWKPVLIIENKMKSLPYKEQLDKYRVVASNEWKKDKRLINNLFNDNSDNRITYILLSLHTIDDFENWSCKSYEDLLSAFEQSNFRDKTDLPDLDKMVFDDYCSFVKALCEISSNNWTINIGDSFLKTVCPWKTKGYNPDKDLQVKLRIDDIRQKTHYAQILKKLLDELNKKNNVFENLIIEKVESPTKAVKNDKTFDICCSTNFFHNEGLLEIYVRWEWKKEEYLVGVQIQGNAYEHFFFDAKHHADPPYKILCEMKDDLNFFFKFDDNDNSNKYPDCLNTQEIKNKPNNKFEQNFKHLRLGYYKTDHIVYQKILIEDEEITIENIIEAIITDIRIVLEKRKKLRWNEKVL